MATQVQFRRGNTSQTSTFTGAVAEITVDTDKKTIVVHDGVTAGGYALALESAQQDAQAFAKANGAFDKANAAYNQANTNTGDITVIQGVNLTQNTNITNAQNKADGAFNHANAAFDKANTNAGDILVIQGVNLTQNTNITTAQTKADQAFSHANSSFDKANTNASDITTIQGVNLTQNTNITNAQNKADAAFIRANNSLNANVGGTITGAVTITANLNVLGNLIVSGNVKTIDTETLNISDPLIYLAANNYSSDLVDIGFVGNYYDGSNQRHTGLIRKFNTDNFYIFTNYDKEPDDNLIDVNDTSFKKATLYANLNTQSITFNETDLKIYIDNAYAAANAATATDATQNTNITAAQTKADRAFDQANLAFDKANTDVTNVSVSAETYGNSTHYGVVTVAANGRVTSVQTFVVQDSSSLAFAIALG